MRCASATTPTARWTTSWPRRRPPCTRAASSSSTRSARCVARALAPLASVNDERRSLFSNSAGRRHPGASRFPLHRCHQLGGSGRGRAAGLHSLPPAAGHPGRPSRSARARAHRPRPVRWRRRRATDSCPGSGGSGTPIVRRPCRRRGRRSTCSRWPWGSRISMPGWASLPRRGTSVPCSQPIWRRPS